MGLNISIIRSKAQTLETGVFNIQKYTSQKIHGDCLLQHTSYKKDFKSDLYTYSWYVPFPVNTNSGNTVKQKKLIYWVQKYTNSSLCQSVFSLSSMKTLKC